MKATRANLLGEFTGKLDGLIYFRRKLNGRLYVRKQWKFHDHPEHPRFRNTQRAIFALSPSPEYIQDMRDYLQQYNKIAQNYQAVHAWSNLYAKLMYAMQRAMPETVVLDSITREQIARQNLPCRTVKAAVDAGLLPPVKGYERYCSEL